MFQRDLRANLPDLLRASGVVAADYDGDGDLDLHFTGWHTEDHLYRNDGHLEFTKVTEESGMGGSNGPGMGAAWSDYDGDGDLDLYVANRSGSAENWTPNHLWHNNGDGTFTDVAADLGVDDLFATIQPVWFDYDLDGDPDLYLSTDKGGTSGATNRLFRNDGVTFTEVSEESRSNVGIDSMGVGLGDIDLNGHLDLYCTNIPGGNPLLLNSGNGTFVNAMKEAGVGSYATGWAAHFFDFDNDADDDLYVCNMSDGLNRLYRNPRSFPLEDVAAVSNVSCYGDSYCLAVGDIDLDGDLDMVVQNHHELIRVYMNTEGNQRNWIKFDVKGVGKNPFAVGARLISVVDGTDTIHEIAAGSNYKSSNDYIQHFGLNQEEYLEMLHITFPDGAVRALVNAPANRMWDLLHPDLLGDYDSDGDVDEVDLAAFPIAYREMEFEHGWEELDFSGNFLIDDDDIMAFLEMYTGPIEDCDEDGTIDAIQIARGDASDQDRDGRIDDCNVPGDLDGDGRVDGADLNELLGWWGQNWPPADFNSDGTVDGDDLLFLLARWTP